MTSSTNRSAASPSAPGQHKRLRIGRHGRLVIPAEYRRALGLLAGSEVLVLLRDGKIELCPATYGLAAARKLFQRRSGRGRSLSAELIAERRTEEL